MATERAEKTPAPRRGFLGGLFSRGKHNEETQTSAERAVTSTSASAELQAIQAKLTERRLTKLTGIAGTEATNQIRKVLSGCGITLQEDGQLAVETTTQIRGETRDLTGFSVHEVIQSEQGIIPNPKRLFDHIKLTISSTSGTNIGGIGVAEGANSLQRPIDIKTLQQDEDARVGLLHSLACTVNSSQPSK